MKTAPWRQHPAVLTVATHARVLQASRKSVQRIWSTLVHLERSFRSRMGFAVLAAFVWQQVSVRLGQKPHDPASFRHFQRREQMCEYTRRVLLSRIINLGPQIQIQPFSQVITVTDWPDWLHTWLPGKGRVEKRHFSAPEDCELPIPA